MQLRSYQEEAIAKMHNGCVLHGGVGSGKSLTALAYYYIRECDGTLGLQPTKMKHPKKLLIITTARKRDTYEWEGECEKLLLSKQTTIEVDSWNNIKKYENYKNYFIIFDEQRVVGWGAWAKAFVKMAKNNRWILLSATPGDKYEDYIALFIANGYIKNKSEFNRNFCVWNPHTTYPSILRYLNEPLMNKWRRELLVDMDYTHDIIFVDEDVKCSYRKELYNYVLKERKDPYTCEPIENASAWCQALRKVTNEDDSRKKAVLEIKKKHDRLIIFYNYNYERDILLGLDWNASTVVAEWNGHKHDAVPDAPDWVYLVQYTAGAEGWNCIVTNAILFYSQNYSYKIMTQAKGRIDRMNTPYKELYYYILKSDSPIDKAIASTLRAKKKFNETKYYEKCGPKEDPRVKHKTSDYSCNNENYLINAQENITYYEKEGKLSPKTNSTLPSKVYKKESDFQADLIKEIKRRLPGAMVLKNDANYIQGIPDLTVLYGAKWAMLEVKLSSTASHRPNQDYYVNKANQMAYSAFVCPENMEGVLNELESALES